MAFDTGDWSRLAVDGSLRALAAAASVGLVVLRVIPTRYVALRHSVCPAALFAMLPTLSRATRVATTMACVLAVATSVACRQQIPAAPLREDAELSKRLAAQDARVKKFDAARDMTQEQADLLEERLAANPADFDARSQLVNYYRTSSTVAWDKKVPGLRRHALWLIEHHPEHEIEPPPLSPDFDPEGFAAAKKLWEAHLARPDASPYLISQAASFFAPHDKPYAEQLIRRGMAIDPESAALKARMPAYAAGYEWPARLASLYAAAIRGSESAFGTHNDVRTHRDRLKSAYAMQVRGTLDTTTDTRLLAGVGGILARPTSLTRDSAMNQQLAETRALGIRYLERALELDPTLDRVKATLGRLNLPDGPATDADRPGPPRP
jgi:hypothetical protein